MEIEAGFPVAETDSLFLRRSSEFGSGTVRLCGFLLTASFLINCMSHSPWVVYATSSPFGRENIFLMYLDTVCYHPASRDISWFLPHSANVSGCPLSIIESQDYPILMGEFDGAFVNYRYSEPRCRIVDHGLTDEWSFILQKSFAGYFIPALLRFSLRGSILMTGFCLVSTIVQRWTQGMWRLLPRSLDSDVGNATMGLYGLGMLIPQMGQVGMLGFARYLTRIWFDPVIAFFSTKSVQLDYGPNIHALQWALIVSALSFMISLLQWVSQYHAFYVDRSS